MCKRSAHVSLGDAQVLACTRTHSSARVEVLRSWSLFFSYCVHPYRSALRGFLFIFPVRLGSKEGKLQMYRLRKVNAGEARSIKASLFPLKYCLEANRLVFQRRIETTISHVSYNPTINAHFPKSITKVMNVLHVTTHNSQLTTPNSQLPTHKRWPRL